MSLFKAFANYCRKSNERAMRRNDARRKQKAMSSSHSTTQRSIPDNEIHCCKNCYYYGYEGRCFRVEKSVNLAPHINNPWETVCDEFSLSRGKSPY